MTYTTGKVGQTVYYQRKHYEPAEEVTLVRYYKDYPLLVKPNMAVITFKNGITLHVSVQTIFARKRKESA